MSYLTNKDFLLEVARGKVSGASIIRRFGVNADIDTAGEEDIWAPGGSVSWLPSAVTVDFASSSVNDTNTAGTGARTIKVYGLNGSYADTNETITLNGTTTVTSSNTYIFIDRVELVTSGSSETNEGTITCIASAVTYATILPGFGNASSAVYQVPASKTAYIIGWNASLYKATSGSVELRLMVALDGIGWAVVDLLELTQSGAGESSRASQGLLIPLTAKARVKVRAKTSADNMGLASTLSIIMI